MMYSRSAAGLNSVTWKFRAACSPFSPLRSKLPSQLITTQPYHSSAVKNIARSNRGLWDVFEDNDDYHYRNFTPLDRDIPGSRFTSLRKVVSNGMAQEWILDHSGGESVEKAIFHHEDEKCECCSPVSQVHTRIAKRLAIQVIIGVTYLHRCGITHGGLGIDKLKFYNDFDSAPIIEATNRIRGVNKLDPIPPYLLPVLNDHYAVLTRNIKIGGATDVFPHGHGLYDGHGQTPFTWRRGFPEAPETFKNGLVDWRADLWDLGFLIWQLFAGTRTFLYKDHDFLGSLIWLTGDGPAPDWLTKHKMRPMRPESELDAWETQKAKTKYQSIKELFKQSYREPSGDDWYGEDIDEGHPLYDDESLSDEEYDERWKLYTREGDEAVGLAPEEVKIVGEIISSLVKICPRDRATAAKILENEWWYTR